MELGNRLRRSVRFFPYMPQRVKYSMAALRGYQPLVTAPFEGVCHRTAACRATRRKRRAPEAERSVSTDRLPDSWFHD
jgi:hypothetical protein